jgi:inner membrane protein involved in colicin E2 resistance
VNPALKKGLAIVGVALLLLFPLAWLHGLVSERTALREQAIASVARGWGGRQMLSGPILAIPVTTTTDDGHTRTGDWYVLPEALNLDVELTVQDERRRLGVYEVPVYVAKVRATGQFDLAREIVKITAGNDSIHAHPDRGRLLTALEPPARADTIPTNINHLSIFVSSLTPSLPTPCWPPRKSYTHA